MEKPNADGHGTGRRGWPFSARLLSAPLMMFTAIRADCDRIVARELPAHEYATVATWGGAD
jgi:hypothetical protein